MARQSCRVFVRIDEGGIGGEDGFSFVLPRACDGEALIREEQRAVLYHVALVLRAPCLSVELQSDHGWGIRDGAVVVRCKLAEKPVPGDELAGCCERKCRERGDSHCMVCGDPCVDADLSPLGAEVARARNCVRCHP